MARPITKNARPKSFNLDVGLIETLENMASSSDLSVSEYVETLLFNGISGTSNINIIKLIEEEIKLLQKKRIEYYNKIKELEKNIEDKKAQIKKARAENRKFSELDELLNAKLEEKKEFFLNILISKIVQKEEIDQIKIYAIKHSNMLGQKYTWKELLDEAMKKTKG